MPKAMPAAGRRPNLYERIGLGSWVGHRLTVILESMPDCDSERTAARPSRPVLKILVIRDR